MRQDHNLPLRFPLCIAAGQLIAPINVMLDEQLRVQRRRNQMRGMDGVDTMKAILTV